MRISPQFALPCTLVFLAAAPGVFADDHDKKTDVTISAPVEVPGGVILQPGTYMFRLMDATANRHIVRISSEDGKQTYAITMTAAAKRTQRTDKTVLTFYEMPGDSPQAVRQWFWPGDVDGQEFLYPHKRAAEITQVTKQTVPEAPDDQPLADNTPPAATPDPLVASAATTPEPAPATPPAPEPVQIAQATPPPPPPSSNSTPDAAPSTPQNSNNDAPLPQTASDLPLFALIGCISLVTAVMMRRMVRA